MVHRNSLEVEREKKRPKMLMKEFLKRIPPSTLITFRSGNGVLHVHQKKKTVYIHRLKILLSSTEITVSVFLPSSSIVPCSAGPIVWDTVTTPSPPQRRDLPRTLKPLPSTTDGPRARLTQGPNRADKQRKRIGISSSLTHTAPLLDSDSFSGDAEPRVRAARLRTATVKDCQARGIPTTTPLYRTRHSWPR